MEYEAQREEYLRRISDLDDHPLQHDANVKQAVEKDCRGTVAAPGRAPKRRAVPTRGSGEATARQATVAAAAGARGARHQTNRQAATRVEATRRGTTAKRFWSDERVRLEGTSARGDASAVAALDQDVCLDTAHMASQPVLHVEQVERLGRGSSLSAPTVGLRLCTKEEP